MKQDNSNNKDSAQTTDLEKATIEREVTINNLCYPENRLTAGKEALIFLGVTTLHSMILNMIAFKIGQKAFENAIDGRRFEDHQITFEKFVACAMLGHMLLNTLMAPFWAKARMNNHLPEGPREDAAAKALATMSLVCFFDVGVHAILGALILGYANSTDSGSLYLLTGLMSMATGFGAVALWAVGACLYQIYGNKRSCDSVMRQLVNPEASRTPVIFSQQNPSITPGTTVRVKDVEIEDSGQGVTNQALALR